MTCRRLIHPTSVLCITAALAATVRAQVLSDSLQGSTIGTRSGGTFVAGGWRVDNQYDSIFWHVPNLNHGAFEYDVVGLATTCPGGAFGSKNEISEMYDFTWNNADNQYAPGYQNVPFKQYLRKQCEAGKENKMEILWQILPNLFEDDSSPFSWDPAMTYHFRNEWLNTGGNAFMYTYRNGALVWSQVVPGSWTPGGLSVRIAASSRRADEGAQPGAVYSNVKVWNLDTMVPAAPSVTVPANGETINTKNVYVRWTGDPHTQYQVRVNVVNDPNSGTIWDSQQAGSSRDFTWTGILNDFTTYYVFVRLGAAGGWGNWSATGRTFTVNTTFSPSGTNYVTVKGNSYANFSGPFLGLGFTYMRALQRCKFDRNRYTSDLAFMSSKGYNYQRILTMVAWTGVEIAPVSFGSVPAWSDYDQQLKDCIDIAYDTYGIRTEVTIFADAQVVMPNDSTRIAHLDRILNDMVGREHKVVLLEVANEYWQNGFPDPAGFNDVESKANYLAVRTPIPVSLSSPSDTSDFGITSAYSGSSGDVSTVHLSRDVGTVEGHWLPVHDSYRPVLGIPPMSSNEPIGNGSSVASETDPIKLCMAAIVAWTSGCPSYVFHCKAGIQGFSSCCPPSGTEFFFSTTAGVDTYAGILPLLPKDMASWERNDGKSAAAPFTSFCAGQANKYWPEVGGAPDGCDRNISTIKSGRFVATPIGILGGGLTLQARRPMKFKAYNPMDGSLAYDLTKNANDTFTLAQGQQAYVIIGDFTDVPLDGGGTSMVSIDLGTTDVPNGMTHVICCDGMTTPATIGGRNCRQNVSQTNDRYFYFGVSDGFALNGSKPDVYISMDYYDTGTGTFVLTYDGASAAYVDASTTVTLTNTNTWKTFTWHITDANFGNRENGGADFRIFRSIATTFYIDKVTVFVSAFTGTPVTLPGQIEAENFDNGGEGVAYHDTDTANTGGQYRTAEGVDIEATTDTGSGFNVGAINTGEWLNYQVNVATTGFYDIGLRVASAVSGGTYHIEINGSNVTGSKSFGGTGGWQTWTTTTASHISLNAGVQTLKVFVEAGGWNLNYITVSPFQGPFGGTPRAIPGLIQAEDFDDGGANVAYSDSDATNNGGQYRTTEQVDIEACTDTGGGYNMGWTSPGEWLEYTVNVATTGDYLIKLRIANADSGGLVHLSLNGNNITFSEGAASTGGWQTWTTICIPGIFLTAGNNQVLRVTMDSGDLNINWIEFVFGGVDVVSEDLDTINSDDGMTHPQAGDGNTTAAIVGGHFCRQNVNPAADIYFYFAVFDSYAFQGNFPIADITVDYYDSGTGVLALQYDGLSSAFTGGPSVTLTNTNTWKQAVFHVNDAYFGNRENSGADFRLARTAGNTFYIDTVMVYAASGPGPATNPSPANGATLVPITSTLSWTAGNGATSHDVRFGTVNPPPFVINQTAATYNPGTLTPNTTYFWRIDEKNAAGTNTGTVWSFTTLPVPGAASAPNPANAATLVPITSTLSWTAGSNAASHDVRFGTANPPPFVVNQTATTYNPGTLAANTNYFWRIDEKNSSGTTTGTVWSFTTLPLPGAASAPIPANAATGVSVTPALSWTAGSNTASHDVRFGTANPPPFVINQTGTSYSPGTLLGSTTYFWRIDEKNSSGTTTGTVWSFTTTAAGPPVENVKVAGAMTIDGSSSDWNLSQFVTKVRGGEHVTGDYGINGFDGGVLYYAGYWTGGVLPTSATDHTARMYSLHNSTYLFFLVRVDDSSTQTQNPVGSNWANDCVEFYIDPGNAGGSSPISNSTSDIQLVVDALNQKNVYMTTSGYATQVLNGVTSVVTADANGWWLEVRIAKNALSPAIPASGQFGLDYNFRDNDNNNDPTLTTVYAWSDNSSGAGFPSKIPNKWGKASLAALPPPGTASNPNPANAATNVSTTTTLTWTAGLDATSHDVRFGTANPPPFVINQAGTTYNPGTLATNTTYFWRIDEKNGSGTTTGTVWSFTTAPPPPAPATGPNPANGATNVSLYATLSWTAGSGATSHDVRFGTTNPPPFVVNQVGTTYNPGVLAATTTYFWRIDEKNAGGTTTGTVWSFTTASQSPFGGTARAIPGTIQAEDYDVGGEGNAYHDLSSGNAGGQYRTDNVDIEASTDTGGGYNLAFMDTGEWLEYTVNVTSVGDHTFKLRVASGGGGGAFLLQINGVAVTPTKTFASTGGWQNWTTILAPAVFLNAGTQVLQVYVVTGGWNLNQIDVTYGGADAVHVDLDSTVYQDGMTHPVCCDGNTAGASVGAHFCRQNVSQTADRYMYFAIFDAYSFQGNRPDVWITAEYFDSGTGTIQLQYDGISSPYTVASSVTLGNTNTWKTASWHVTDGYFGNRQNGGADFRIARSGTNTWYLDTVQTSLAQP